jgi:hypothetical protein
MKRLSLIALLLAFRIHAATFIVPDDRTLVRTSKAIVIATVGESHSQWEAGGHWIETVTAMRVDESIRGAMSKGETFDVAELGGSVGAMSYLVEGSPRYVQGDRVLLFLETNDRGAWCAKSMIVGKFDFTHDVRGRALLARESRELVGWDLNGGARHREPQRLASEFVQYVRGVARGEEPAINYVIEEKDRAAVIEAATTTATPTINSYLLGAPQGIRRATFPTPVVYVYHGSQPGALNGGLTALNRALNSWTSDAASNVVLQNGGPTTTSNGLSTSDGINSIQFNDPLGEIPGTFNPAAGGTLAIGGAFATGTHTFGGETFTTIVEGDLVVQDGISGAGLTGNGFDHVMTHELGHTIGFRHSDQPPAGGSSSTDSVMLSFVNFNSDATGATLLSWDKEALAAVYPAGGSPTPNPPPGPTPGPNPPPTPPPSCTPPSILSQPKAASTINTAVTLTVIAAPTPLQYQWYIGAKGNTSSPVSGAISAEITILPPVTTTYWVRVSNGCDPAANSDAVAVTVNGCPAASIDSQSQSTTILQGKSATLTASASGGTNINLQWYLGSAPDKSAPIAGANGTSITVTPAATTSYWLEATNSCGAFARSETITVTVQPCNAPKIVVQPSGGQVVSGESITLAAAVTGTSPLTLQWFEGAPTNTTRPVANGGGNGITVGPILSATSFWLHATNDCGEVSTVAAPVTIASSCISPSITTQPAPVIVASGASATLSVNATGTSLTYNWYEGPVFDFTKPVGVTGPVLVTSAITAPTQFWVRITNNCGAINSVAANVSVISGKHRGVNH